MTLEEIETFLKEKGVNYEKNTYIYDNAEIVIKDLDGCTSLMTVDKIEIKFLTVENIAFLRTEEYTQLDLYLSNHIIAVMDISKIKALTYVEWDNSKKEEPITIEHKLDKFYEELIKPFIVKVAKDIYKEIKNDKS